MKATCSKIIDGKIMKEFSLDDFGFFDPDQTRHAD
jgi:hypothetical protein